MILFIALYNSSSYTSGDTDDGASLTFPNDTIPSLDNETDLSDPAAYSFSSKLCPFGFEPLFVSNKTQVKQIKVGAAAASSAEAADGEEVTDGEVEVTRITQTNITLPIMKATKCVAPGECCNHPIMQEIAPL